MTNPAPSILIVGAGPTGLVLALSLKKQGVSFRIIDKNPTPAMESRAMAVHARTLEFYQQLGIAEDAIAAGIKAQHLVMRKNGLEVVHAELGDMGAGLSPYPYVLTLPQDDHEKLLLQLLEKEGVTVERNTELLSLTQDETGVTATLNTGLVKADYICGCDGARSVVRHGLVGSDFPGGTYSQVFYVADVQAKGEAQNGVNLCVSQQDFCMVFPLRRDGAIRLIGILPTAHGETIEFDDVKEGVIRNTGLQVSQVNWFTTYHVHHRMAPSFRVKRAFLLGDAAHIHSPAGGQGMNTGIGDAINLAWKLAAVMQKRGSPSLLDSYAAERMAFARVLIATTDRMFHIMAGMSWINRIWRGFAFTRIAGFMLRFKRVQQLMFRTVSQIKIQYRMSPISLGAAGKIYAGDRLPWVETVNNFAPLASRDWQIHVYGNPQRALRDMAARRLCPLHVFAYDTAAKGAGLAKNAAYLIRPDGHVAVADPVQNYMLIEDYLSRFLIIPRA